MVVKKQKLKQIVDNECWFQFNKWIIQKRIVFDSHNFKVRIYPIRSAFIDTIECKRIRVNQTVIPHCCLSLTQSPSTPLSLFIVIFNTSYDAHAFQTLSIDVELQ